MTRMLAPLFLFLSFSLYARTSEVLQFIKQNYEYNIELIEKTYQEHGISINLSKADKTINLNALEAINHRHPLAEIGYKTGLMKRKFLKKISNLEKEVYKLYPHQGYYVGFQSYFALKKTEKEFPPEIGQELDVKDPMVDSFKHTYWSHLITHKINSEFAKLWFTARELQNMGSGLIDLRETSDSYMDMLNNVIGMKTPKDSFMDRLLGNSVPSQITRKQKYGRLFFNDHGVIRTTDQVD